MAHATLEALEARKARLEEQLAETRELIKERKKNAASRLAAAYGKEIQRLQAQGVKVPRPEQLAKLVASANAEKASGRKKRRPKRPAATRAASTPSASV